MDAVQAMTGHGGWPLNAFATPGQVPFYAGTYYPPEQRGQLPSWRQVLEAVSGAWAQRRDEILEGSEQIVRHLSSTARLEPSGEPIRGEELEQAIRVLEQQFDPQWGGWGGAPKFPAASVVELLLRRGERRMSLQTLRAMATGGIYDQVGGGFSRYAVDRTWTVPHFEKMLYDNALLARAYLHAFQLTGDPLFERVVRETLDWALRELQGEEGGFASALDADSEGVEGRYYVWTLGELRDLLGEGLLDEAVAYFGATEEGNFEGANVLEARGPEPAPERRAEIRRRLYEARERRVRPGLDDKRLTSWNALMLSALGDAGAALGEPRYLEAAVRNADFLWRELRDERGRLLRTWKDGRGRIAGYLEDHAFLLQALLTLYEATFDARWFHAARETADAIVEHFADDERGGFFTTAADSDPLVARRKDLEDMPIPSGGAAAAFGLLRLAALSGDHAYEERALGQVRLVNQLVPRHPVAFAHVAQAIDFHLARVREVALVGEDLGELAGVLRGAFRPHVVSAGGDGLDDAGVPLLADRPPRDGLATAYVCEGFACRAPVTSAEELRALLEEQAPA
jgi:uncharacterized protein YyaL (SSP411 family)